MRRLIAIGLMVGLASVWPGCQTPQQRPKDIEAEAYMILNEIIEDNNLSVDPLCMTPLGLDVEGKEWSAEFSPEDRAFIKRSQDSLSARVFKPGIMVAWHSKDQDWLPIEIVQENDSSSYDELSWPVFDLKREKALVHFASGSNGFLSGSGRKVLYVKLRGRWKRWKVYDNWIS